MRILNNILARRITGTFLFLVLVHFIALKSIHTHIHRHNGNGESRVEKATGVWTDDRHDCELCSFQLTGLPVAPFFITGTAAGATTVYKDGFSSWYHFNGFLRLLSDRGPPRQQGTVFFAHAGCI